MSYLGKLKFILPLLVIILAIFLFFDDVGPLAQPSTAQRLPGFPPDKYYLGKILEISDITQEETGEYPQTEWVAKIRIVRGEIKDQIVEVPGSTSQYSPDYMKVRPGDAVVVQKIEALGEFTYGIYDKYRIWPMAFILFLFFALVIFFSRTKGVGSILGLIISILILAKYVVPRILAGQDPLLISLLGAIAIAILAIYTAHGFNKRTSIALISTIITLGISALLSILFVALAKLSGMGSEGAFYLQTGGFENLNLKGLLLGGIIIGALGVLDDITTGQAAAVDEIKKANPELSFSELYRRGISVGKEHISSLVNTLFLAYAGASLPLFLLFTVNPSEQPLWVIINGEFIAEEIIRTLVGSTVLVLAVPIATLLAAYFYSRRSG